MRHHVLAIDEGTSSTRAIVFDRQGRVVAAARREIASRLPRTGWIEQDPRELWTATLDACRSALAQAAIAASELCAIGIANQRETTVIWDRANGEPIHDAIVWSDRRTDALCRGLRAAGCESLVADRTGLLLDPYFSATKIAWILDAVPGARRRAERGELAFGTIDSLLLWHLSGGCVHATDATNASRTALFDIRRGCWDDELLDIFRVPREVLPRVMDTAGAFGATRAGLLGGAVPILAIAGDQQASMIGQACTRPGMIKATYGTGAFVLVHTGDHAVRSSRRLLTTIAYQGDGKRSYALEGSIFCAGTSLGWLQDGLGIVSSAAEASELAAQADPGQAVYLVPAFSGLGAPHWSAAANAMLIGLTSNTTRREIARAALEAVAYQTHDLVQAMWADTGADTAPPVLRVDGGLACSDWTMQFLADMVRLPVDRAGSVESTAAGVARLAGWKAGIYADPLDGHGTFDAERRFLPAQDTGERARRLEGWHDAVARLLGAPARPAHIERG